MVVFSIKSFVIASQVGQNMAKTKAKTVDAAAEKLKQMTAAVAAPTAPEPKPAPKRRVRSKGGVADPSTAGVGTTIAPELDFDVTWANFAKIKDLHGLTDKETQEVLLKVVGPDPTGTTFWSAYQKRVKAEVLEEATRTALAAPVEPLPADGKRPVEVEVKSEQSVKRRRHEEPAELPEPEDAEDADDTYVEECEEEAFEEDAVLDDIEVQGGTGKDDDQDSPTSGVVAAVMEKPLMQVSPTEPVEPVKVPLEKDAGKDARDELEEKLKTTPTATRSTRFVNHNVIRMDDDDENVDDPVAPLKSSLPLAFFSVFLFHLPILTFCFVNPYCFCLIFSLNLFKGLALPWPLDNNMCLDKLLLLRWIRRKVSNLRMTLSCLSK